MRQRSKYFIGEVAVKISSLLIAVAVMPLLYRYLAVDDIAHYNVAQSSRMFLPIVLTLGAFSGFGHFFISRKTDQSRRAVFWGVSVYIWALMSLMMALFAMVHGLFAPDYPLPFGYMVVLWLFIPLFAYFEHIRSFFLGMELFRAYYGFAVLATMGQIVAMVFAVLYFADGVMVLAFSCASLLCIGIASFFVLRRHLPYTAPKWRLVKAIVKISPFLAYGSVLGVLVPLMDKYAVLHKFDAQTTALYSTGESVGQLAVFIMLASVGSIYGTEIYKALRSHKPDFATTLEQHYTAIVALIVLPVGLGFVAFGTPVLHLYVGEQLYGAERYTVYGVMGCVLMFYCWVAITGRVLFYYSRASMGVMGIAVLAVLANTGLNAIAPTAPHVGMATLTVYGMAVLACGVLRYKYLGNGGTLPLFAGLLCVAGAVFGGGYMMVSHTHGMIGAFAYSTTALLVYWAVAWLVFPTVRVIMGDMYGDYVAPVVGAVLSRK